MMSGLYSIPLAGLREGRYTYDFSIGDDFFEMFEESEIRKGELRADVTLDKRSSHLELAVKIEGMAEITCDRCLDLFPIRISCTNRLIVTRGKAEEGDDPDMMTIQPDEYELDLSQYFYENIHLALPLKRIHPDTGGKSGCNPEMIKKLDEHRFAEEENNDPRWDDLKKINESSKN